VQQAAKALNGGGQVFSSSEYAKEMKVSIRLVNEMVRLFERADLMGALADQPGCYVLLKSPEHLKVKDILDTILQDGTSPDELGLNHLDAAVQKVLTDLDTGLEQSMEQVTVRDLARAS